jgi:hypothetical protein
LLDKVRARGLSAEVAMLNKGYDNERVDDECRERSVTPIIPLRKGRRALLSAIPHGTDEWKVLYRRRSAVELESGRLKHTFGAVLGTCGLRKAQLHADVVMLARLSRAQSSAGRTTRRLERHPVIGSEISPRALKHLRQVLLTRKSPLKLTENRDQHSPLGAICHEVRTFALLVSLQTLVQDERLTQRQRNGYTHGPIFPPRTAFANLSRPPAQPTGATRRS